MSGFRACGAVQCISVTALLPYEWVLDLAPKYSRETNNYKAADLDDNANFLLPDHRGVKSSHDSLYACEQTRP
jgi:hypothetical protein